MIITVDDIRKYREIARNTQMNRVEIFIRETEELDIVPLLGVEEYDRLANRDEQTELTDAEKMLLNGGTWIDGCGNRHRFAGLVAAEAYLVFARFIRTHPLQVTPYGVVVKDGDDSVAASAQSIAAVSKDSEKIGRQYLADAVKYWRYVSQTADCNAKHIPASRPKFIAIGD